MSGSTQRRWHGGWIAGAGLACLGAASISVSGCTTPSTADLNAASKKDQQVAKTAGASAEKKASAKVAQTSGDAPSKKDQQVVKTAGASTEKKGSAKVAAKDVSGKARVSDMDDTAEARIVARKTPPKSDDSKRPASQTRRQETVLASATDVEDTAPERPGVSKAYATSAAAKRRKSAEPRSAAIEAPSEPTAQAVSDNDSRIPSTGNRPLPPTAETARRTTESRRPVSPQPNLDFEAAADAETTPQGSSHERRRADRLMERAHERYRSGYPEESLRLASVAFELEKSRQAVYRRGEERPSDYITWLQSVAMARDSNPPVIRPQRGADQSTANVPEAGSSITAAGAQASDRRRMNDVIRANAGANFPSSANTGLDAANGTSSNTGVDLAAPEAPRFDIVNPSSSRAGANAGQVEVPVPPKPRSADTSVAMTNTGAASLESPALSEVNRVVIADRLQDKTFPAPAPRSDTSADTAAMDAHATNETQTENDAFVESEAPGLIPARTTQLTIASIVGLVTGIAGMFGLSWWRHQERRHYAAGK